MNISVKSVGISLGIAFGAAVTLPPALYSLSEAADRETALANASRDVYLKLSPAEREQYWKGQCESSRYLNYVSPESTWEEKCSRLSALGLR